MALLSTDEVRQLTIEKMIFHVVGHDQDLPTYFSEVQLGTHHNFFLERVKSTINGPRYVFHENSSTLEALIGCQSENRSFTATSKALARAFHDLHRTQTSPGLLMFFQLAIGEMKLYCIIKYEHQEVLSYSPNSHSAVVLRRVQNSFVRSASALQKSAFIRSLDDINGLVVIDRQNPAKPADYYLTFLGVRRTQSEDDLTKKLDRFAIEIDRMHKRDLPTQVQGTLRRRAYDYVQNAVAFDEEIFITALCGALPEDSPIRATFNDLLVNEHMDGSTFTLSKSALKYPKKRTIKTAEHVKIEIPETADESVVFTPLANNRYKITITTDSYLET